MEESHDISVANVPANDRKIIVAIDFGTTFSGIAWAETRRADVISVTESWPSRIGSFEGASSAKVPTELLYTPDGLQWGFQIPPLVPRWKWFKLKFAGTTSQPEPGQTYPDGQFRSPEDLTAAYLAELVKHLMYDLREKLGSAILQTVPLQFVLTVPAIWSESAKQKTLAACQRAGIRTHPEILLVSEPEAAAIYALHGLDPHGLEIGDSFVLCDAGGGTVDLISYTVVELFPALKIEEAAPGSGGLCGSTFLNQMFAEYLVAKLKQPILDDQETFAEAMQTFDSVIKMQYSPSASAADGYSIALPGFPNDESLGIRRNRLKIKATDLRQIFEPTMNQIIDLVRGQIRATNKTVKAVLLVGGFGQNSYLNDSLRNTFGDGIRVLQPVNAWTAVVRGAVMMGLAHCNSQLAQVTLVSRRARKHYGLQLSTEFDPKTHDKFKRFWSTEDQAFRIQMMVWFIKRNDPVAENRPHLIHFHKDFPVSAGRPKSTTIKVWHDANSTASPIYQNENVRPFVSLVARLGHLKKSELFETITRLADGFDYYRITGAVEATFYGTSTKYCLIYRGKRYDTVTAEYV